MIKRGQHKRFGATMKSSIAQAGKASGSSQMHKVRNPGARHAKTASHSKGMGRGKAY